VGSESGGQILLAPSVREHENKDRISSANGFPDDSSLALIKSASKQLAQAGNACSSRGEVVGSGRLESLMKVRIQFG
jgi:hypothetical protein